MTRHRGSESCLALVYTLLLATLVVSSSAALTREATTRTASPLVSKDTLTTATGRQQQHSVATRTPPALAAQPRVDINASLREIHTNNTNATDAHGNVEQSRWWWWWTWWAAPRVVYIYPGHQQQYPHNPYPPVQPPLVEPNCPQVSLFQVLILYQGTSYGQLVYMTTSCLFYTQVTTGNGQPVRDCCCPSGCAIR